MLYRKGDVLVGRIDKGGTSEKHLLPINLKLTIPTYFETLITNMTLKILENLIFKAKTKKKSQNCNQYAKFRKMFQI